MTSDLMKKAPPEVKLAIDIIYLFEINNIEPETALKALAIVTKDFQQKIDNPPEPIN